MTTSAKHIVRSATATLTLALVVALFAGSPTLAAPAGAQRHKAACTTTTSHATHGRNACTHTRLSHKHEKRSSTSSTDKGGSNHGRGRRHHSVTRSVEGSASEAQTGEEAEEEEEEEALQAGEEGGEASEES